MNKEEELSLVIARLNAKIKRLENYGILLEDIEAYCKAQPKKNYTAQRILEAIKSGFWGVNEEQV